MRKCARNLRDTNSLQRLSFFSFLFFLDNYHNAKSKTLESANLTPLIDGPRVATLKTHLYLKFSLKATQIRNFSSIHCLRKS